MKIPPRQIEQFVKSPSPEIRVILIYGPDSGLMRERSKTIGLTIVDEIHDPFNVAMLSSEILNEDPAKLQDEACAMSMMGGDRLVRVETASDKITNLVKDYLDDPNPSALIILEAGELSPRSSLRKLCEKSDNAAAIPCYVEDARDLGRFIRETFQKEGLQVDADSVHWLAANISGNRQKVRSELEKLVIYKGSENTPISLGDVQACCGEAGSQSLDDLVYSVAGRQPAHALKTYNQLLEEGVAFITILRSLQNHFRRLHLTKSRMHQGDSQDRAVKSLRPPLFFKNEGPFNAQLKIWSLPLLDKVLDRLADVEAQCKQTGFPAETLCGQAVLGISTIKT